MRSSLGFGFAWALALLLCADGAQARRESTYQYPYSRVWTTLMRMVRVDFASPITEKDRESGYFLFDYPDAGKTFPGSVEVVRVVENGFETSRVVIQVPGLPTYFEQMMLDKLTRKLNQDYGQPTPVKAQPPQAPGSAPPPASGKDKEEAPKTPAADNKPGTDGTQPPAPPRTPARRSSGA